MYLYETHLHTAPVSACARASVRESLEFYKQKGYAGVFITNHFLDGNVNISHKLPWEERLKFYFTDYEAGVELGKEIGISVFFGIETSYNGADFLVYGLDPQWYLDHQEIKDMEKPQQLSYFMEHGALVIHAHPFRERDYLQSILLFPRYVHGVEIYNAVNRDFENQVALQYANNYELIHFAGSDNHVAGKLWRLAGVQFETPVLSETDFVQKVLNGQANVFQLTNPQK